MNLNYMEKYKKKRNENSINQLDNFAVKMKANRDLAMSQNW